LQGCVAASPTPQIPIEDVEKLQADLRKSVTGFENAISPSALYNMKRLLQRMGKDWEQAQKGELSVNRQRARSSHKSGELRLLMKDYHPKISEVIKLGFSVSFINKEGPTIVRLAKIDDSLWGFKASVIRKEAIAMKWEDRELIEFLKYGFYDYSEDTPPISSISPQQKKALVNVEKFSKDIEKELDKGWMDARPTQWPSYIPFRTTPGSVEPKKQPGEIRVVWNASHPLPHARDGVIIDKKVGEMPINSNASTTLPRWLQFERTAIESISLAIEIIIPLAKEMRLPILGRTYDFEKWFRQLKMAHTEAWKSNITMSASFHSDLRMQMGRSASAHSGQRLSSLIAHSRRIVGTFS